MTICYYMPGIRHGLEHVALDNLEALTRDLRRFQVEGGPTADELAVAPLLSHWAAVPGTGVLRLVGVVTGHPHVGPGPGTTSPVHAIDRAHAWMRSSNRLWRLGPARHVVHGFGSHA